jgi:ribosome-binding protein aMBF1 (putative translation factor)
MNHQDWKPAGWNKKKSEYTKSSSLNMDTEFIRLNKIENHIQRAKKQKTFVLFGKNLAKKRMYAHMSQVQLATKLSISINKLRLIEVGEIGPTSKIQNELTRIFG